MGTISDLLGANIHNTAITKRNTPFLTECFVVLLGEGVKFGPRYFWSDIKSESYGVN